MNGLSLRELQRVSEDCDYSLSVCIHFFLRVLCCLMGKQNHQEVLQAMLKSGTSVRVKSEYV